MILRSRPQLNRDLIVRSYRSTDLILLVRLPVGKGLLR